MTRKLYTIKNVTLANGLKVSLVKIRKYSTIFAGVVAPIGSITSFGTIDGQKIPTGIAHFLEHRLFDTPKGDAFELLSSLGCEVNAYTTYNFTCYHFSCSANLMAGLEILLDFTTNLTFDATAVENEKKIIIQELNMYNDHPNARLRRGMLENLFQQSPIRYDIGGTPDDVNKTTLEDLKKVFATFYSLDKLKLYIVGDYPSNIVEELNKIPLKSAPCSHQYLENLINEPSSINQVFSKTIMDVPIPLLAMGVKFPKNIHQQLKIKLSAYQVLLDIIAQGLFDAASLLVKKLKKANLYEAGFSGVIGTIVDETVAIISSSAPKLEPLQEILKDFFKAPYKYFLAKDFERIKKSLYGQYLIDISRPAGLFDGYIHLDQIHGKIEESIQSFANLKYEDALLVLKEMSTLEVASHLIRKEE